VTDLQDKQLEIADPGEAAKAAALIARIDAPEMDSPGGLTVSLLVGVSIHGEMVKKATVRELNGSDEEAMAIFQSTPGNDEDTLLFGFLLSRACTHIGDSPTEGTDLVNQLTMGDRDKVFLAIVKASYGVNKMFHVTCPKCNEKLDVVVNLDEEFTEIPVPPEMQENGTLSIPLLKGRVAHVRLPTGITQARAAKQENFAGATTAIIAECLVEITGGLPIAGPKLDIARNLSIPDRNTITRFLSEERPGPRINNVPVPCDACGTEITVRMDWGSLLYP
jgi:hypothetical protein